MLAHSQLGEFRPGHLGPLWRKGQDQMRRCMPQQEPPQRLTRVEEV